MKTKKFTWKRTVIGGALVCASLAVALGAAWYAYGSRSPFLQSKNLKAQSILIPPTQSTPPTPPPDPKLKNFPLDLDLLDFANRNPLPTQHCFFPVKNRKKDAVEYIPAQNTYVFPQGRCELSAQKCYRTLTSGYLPGMKKTDRPVPFTAEETSYRGFPVIPYAHAEDTDFSICMPSWTGYLEENPQGQKQGQAQKIYRYAPPKRDYAKQSCYHPLSGGNENKGNIFCDAEKCQLTDTQYCENKTGQCYANGYPLKNKKGKSVTTYENYPFINWDFCANEAGRLIPSDDGPPYEERFKPGCNYRIEDPSYHEKKYAGKIDFLIKCGETECLNPALNFDMKRKEYWINMAETGKTYSKTPPMPARIFFSINWQCAEKYT